MPYAVPSSPSTEVLTTTATTTTITTTDSDSNINRPHHRRTRSSFSDERGPGAFASLGSLPRRRPSATKKPLFHLSPDDSPPEEDNNNNTDNNIDDQPSTSFAPSTPSAPAVWSALSSLKSARDSGKWSPSVVPPSHIELPPWNGSSPHTVPFPTSSPFSSPTRLSPTLSFRPLATSATTTPTSIPRTPSTPIILSNGKQLKSSLKSSSSSPNIPIDLQRARHLRAQSAPSTPSIVHKNVHFAEKDLETVRVFNRTGKPKSVSKPPDDETETETEAENSNLERGLNSYPFPSLGASPLSPLGLSVPPSHHIMHEIDPAPHLTSSVPAPSPPPLANVHLETVTLPRTRPPTLRGTVLVRNIAYEKTVAVRFTLDDWQTTSEVLCKHVVSLPGLPPPFPRQEKPLPDDDVATRAMRGISEENKGPSWDRFSFTIRLEDYESKLGDRTLWLVARFSAPGGEWWDNNTHHNYRVGFRKAPSGPLSPLATPVPATFPLPSPAKDGERNRENKSNVTVPLSPTSQQRSFSAPSTLRYTPMTGALAGVPVISYPIASSQKSSPAPPMLDRSFSSPPYPRSSSPQIPDPAGPSSASPVSPVSSAEPLQHVPDPASPIVLETAARTTSFIRRRLSLSNYVAPGHSPTEDKRVSLPDATNAALATPPSTPPDTVKLTNVELPAASPPRLASPPPPSPPPPAEEGEEEEANDGAEEKRVDVNDNAEGEEILNEDAPRDYENDRQVEGEGEEEEQEELRLDTSALPASSHTTSNDDGLLPFSPTSLKASTRPFLAFNQGGLMSPPTSRDASEDGGSGEGGRSSPAAGGTPPPEPATDDSNDHPSSNHQTENTHHHHHHHHPHHHLVLPALGLSISNPRHQRHPAEPGGDTSGLSAANRADASYAAFVRQWCFVQSSPPASSPSPASSTTATVTPVHSPVPSHPSPPRHGSPRVNGHGNGGVVGGTISPNGKSLLVGGISAQRRNGSSEGFRIPGLGFSASPDVGMVGVDV